MATYDAAGNMTGDGTHTYQWDAEDRMISMDAGSTATYKYNSLGQRVERFLPNGSWTFDYLFGVGGEDLGVYRAGTAAWFDQEISMGGRILVDNGSPTRILHVNNLGTTTVTNDQTGAELQDELFYPWGQDWTRAGQPYVMHFAGMAFESPDQLYLTDFRKYNSALGRWMSPDLLSGDVSNPQSLNRYAYALNNPVSNIDPSGLSSCATDNIATVDTGGVTPIVHVTTWQPCPAPVYQGSVPGLAPVLPGSHGDPSDSGGPVPSYTQVLKSFNKCAADFADKYSAASLASKFFHIQNNPILNAALGSTTAAVSNLFFQSDPKIYVPAGGSLAAGAKAGAVVKIGTLAASKIPVGGTIYAYTGTTVATRYGPALEMSPVGKTLADTAVGGSALGGVKALGGLLDIALPAQVLYDEALYGIGEGVCTAQAF